MKYYSDSLEKTYEIAGKILGNLGNTRIVLLNGELGSGKTTFVRAILGNLCCKDNVTSPTFTIVQEYDCHGKIYHIDLYRIKTFNEAIDIGIDEYLYSGKYVFIEWPNLIKEQITQDHIIINFKMLNLTSRIIEVTYKI